MNVLYGEIDVVIGDDTRCVLVITQEKGLMIQTREGHMSILPRDTSLFCFIDGPAAAWLGAMKRLNQAAATVFMYGEEAYFMEESLKRWVEGGNGPGPQEPSKPLLEPDVPF